MLNSVIFEYLAQKFSLESMKYFVDYTNVDSEEREGINRSCSSLTLMIFP
jgi:hypothetical protein